MITRDNIKEVVKSISEKDMKRIKSGLYEYCVLELHVFNSGSFVTVKCTNDYNRYKHVSDSGNCILSIDDPIFLEV